MSNYMPFGTFTLAGPPRSVPLSVRLQLLFGGFANQFGWFFFGFGMIFVWVFGALADPTAWLVFRGTLEQAPGVVTRSESTNAKEDGSTIVAHDYEFTVGGKKYRGTSYSLTKHLSAGEKVTVEFPPGNPARSRIKGMRTSIFPVFVLFVVIFPLVGLGFIQSGFRRGWKAIRLLKHGEQALGTLKSKEPTNTSVNNRTVYKLVFEFTDQLGDTHEVVVKTHEPEHLEDDADEPLLYDPIRPTYAAMLDSLPGSPRIGEMGEIETKSRGGTLVIMILPLVTIIGHGLYIFAVR